MNLKNLKKNITNLILKLKSEKGSVLLTNFFSLSVLQLANLILPLIIIPHLVSTLGIEKFGLLAFATATINYFSILSDYGFNLTGTREVSINRNSNHKLTQVFSSIMIIKFSLLLLGLVILILLNFLEKFSQNSLLYFFTFGLVFGKVLFPVWFFQGVEKMKYISIFNILAKLIFVIATIIYVKDPNDILLVPIFNSSGFILAGIISLFYIKIKFNVSFKFQRKDVLLRYLREGWHIFISRLAVVLYTSNNILILGFLTNNTSVGFYSIAEKVINAICSLGGTINRVLFPNLSIVWSVSKLSYHRQLNTVIKSLIVVMLLISIATYLLSPYIISYLSAGKQIQESIDILKILAVTILLFPLGGLFTQSFVTQQKFSLVTKVTLFTTIFNFILVFVMIYFFDFYGLAVSVVFVQIFQTILNLNYFRILKKEIQCVE